MAGVATFGPGVNKGIPISGTFGGGTLGGADTGASVVPNLFGASLNTGVPGDETVDTGGGQAQADPFASLRAGFDTQNDNIYSTSSGAANSAASARHSSILDFLDSLTSGQGAVDERGVQNELAKKQGSDSIVDMVGRGLRSGGVLLSNKNALSSSAAEAIARAYSEIGKDEMNKVNNGYELENRNIGLSQDDLDRQKTTGLRKFGESEQASIEDIATSARDRLAQLDADMVNASMPDRINIQAEQDQIRQQVSTILGQYDQELNTGANGVQAASADTNRATAAGLANKGVSADNPFDFTSETPAQFQGTGPFDSAFPLFSLKSKQATA